MSVRAPLRIGPSHGVPSSFLHYTYPEDVVAAANQNKHTLLSMDVPGRDAMQQMVRQTAAEMGVDPALALAVAHQESGFDARAVSPANAVGTMQVIPSSGVWAGQLVGRELNLLDPQDNVTAGVAILRALQRTSHDLPTAIASYYQGQGSVLAHGMYGDTRRYVANVQTLMTRFGRGDRPWPGTGIQSGHGHHLDRSRAGQARRRPLRGDLAHRPRRDGYRLPGTGSAPGSQRRTQGDASASD